MKACAKKKGISTAQLLEKIHGCSEPGCSALLSLLDAKRQASLKSMFRVSASAHQDASDFKEELPQLPLTGSKKRKRMRDAEENLK